MYKDDDMLMLSGVQHYVFCPRQWALIHVDQQWAENALTTEGELLHKNVDNPAYRQKLNNRITLRSVHIASHELGLYGVSDAVELLPTDQEINSIGHPKYPGRFTPYPVEYKRGHHKTDECDTMQLVCQVMCLEEMYGIVINKAALFYWEVRQREEIEITEDLRSQARLYASEMHRVFESGALPLACATAKCRRCSLSNICMPNLLKSSSVSNYLKNYLYEETT